MSLHCSKSHIGFNAKLALSVKNSIIFLELKLQITFGGFSEGGDFTTHLLAGKQVYLLSTEPPLLPSC